MNVKKYKKKPVIIEAIQFVDDAERITEISNFVGEGLSIDYSKKEPVLKIKTLEGVMTASEGDYIIKGVKGEFYPCKPDIFDNTYEEV
jgi:hypothetical protein